MGREEAQKVKSCAITSLACPTPQASSARWTAVVPAESPPAVQLAPVGFAVGKLSHTLLKGIHIGAHRHHLIRVESLLPIFLLRPSTLM